MKYTRQERLVIGRQIYDGAFSVHDAAEEYGISYYTAREYLRTYKAALRINESAGSDETQSASSGNGAVGMLERETTALSGHDADSPFEKGTEAVSGQREAAFEGNAATPFKKNGMTSFEYDTGALSEDDSRPFTGESSELPATDSISARGPGAANRDSPQGQIPGGNLYRAYLHHLTRDELEDELVEMKVREEKIRRLLG